MTDALLAIIAALVVLLVPGGCLLVATRSHRAIPTMLLPAAALAGTLALLAPMLALCLAFGVTLWFCVAWLAMSTMLGVSAWNRYRRSFRGLITRRVSISTLVTVVLVIIATLATSYVGADLRRDQQYHTQRAVKLAELKNPTFENTSRLIDSGDTAPYAFPLWHAGVAVIAKVSQQPVTQVVYVLPVVLTPILLFALAGLASALCRDRRAAPIAVFVFALMRLLDYVPDYRFVSNLQWPGNIAALILTPIIVVCASRIIDGALLWKRSLALAAGATALIVVLHANYVLYPALIVAGMWVLSLIFTEPENAGQRKWMAIRVAMSALALIATAALAIIAMLPVLAKHPNFGADPLGNKVANAGATTIQQLVDASRGARYFESAGDGVQLKLAVLASTPLAIIGLAVAALLVLRIRSRAAATAVGAVAAILLVSRVPQIAGFVLETGSVGTLQRMWLATIIPTMLALVVVLLALLRRSTIAAFAVGVVMIAAIAIPANSLTWLLQLTPWLLVIGIAALLVFSVLRIVQRARGSEAQTEPVLYSSRAGGQRLSQRIVAPRFARLISTATVALVIVGAAAISTITLDRATDRDPYHKVVHGELASELSDLPNASVVLADPDLSYAIPTIAPLYVAADYKWWLENSDQTDTNVRYDRVSRWYGTPRDPLLLERFPKLQQQNPKSKATHKQRDVIVSELGVDYVVTAKKQQRARKWALSRRNVCIELESRIERYEIWQVTANCRQAIRKQQRQAKRKQQRKQKAAKKAAQKAQQ